MHVAADDNCVRLPGQPVDLFDRDLIDFVVDVDTRNINAVRCDDIDELVLGAVLAEQNFGIENFKGVEDRLHHFLVAACQRACRVEAQAAAFLYFEVDVGLSLVEPNSYRFQLSFEQIAVNIGLRCVQHHQDEVGSSCDGNNLSTTTFSLEI